MGSEHERRIKPHQWRKRWRGHHRRGDRPQHQRQEQIGCVLVDADRVRRAARDQGTAIMVQAVAAITMPGRPQIVAQREIDAHEGDAVQEKDRLGDVGFQQFAE